MALHLYLGPHLRVELLGQWGTDHVTQHLGRPPRAHLRPRLAQVPHRRRVPVALRAGSRARRAQRVAGTAAWPAPCSSCFAPWVEFGPNIGRAVTDVFNEARPSRTAHSRSTPASRATSWSYGGFLNFRPFGDMLIGTRRQLRQLRQPASERQQGQHDRGDQHAVLPGRPVPRPPPAVREGRSAATRRPTSIRLYSHDVRRPDMFSFRLRLMYLY